ncbi:hypothetical protein OG426_01725 [Streptomyces canus]|uniref:hypothetical protein n=1 Tax=Streptomyces canus TaxID=58343 RepID=UPI00224E3EF1|nr:hypothetical protein [Streptomyces canus]MCX4853485.1 hypothetical protein [Streptomyces canus]WSW31317.1 hypothetical protein OG426_01725 [Streptomyces canus]
MGHYDARRDVEIPAHGLGLVAIRPAGLDADSRGCLRRTADNGVAALRWTLMRDDG